MNILFLNYPDKIWLNEINKLQKKYKEHNFLVSKSMEEKQRYIKNAELIIAGHLKEEDLREAIELKCVIVPWVGVNAIPMKALRERGMMLANAPGNTKIVAERALALTLSLLGRVVEFHNDMKKGEWHRSGKPEDDWISLYDRNVAMIGFGNIGKYLTELLKPFNIKISVFKRRVDIERDNGVFFFDNIKDAMKGADIVYICLPLTDDTRNMIGERELKMMKDKYLINIARGEIIKEDALYNALKNNVLKGAALDTWYNYPKIGNMTVPPSVYPFRELDNIVLSPHCAMHTIEGKMLDIDGTMENIECYIQSGSVIYPIDLKRGY